MAYSRDDSIKEWIWIDPQAVYEAGLGMGIHENSVLFYFARSPFFSNASKNRILLDQNDESVIQDRAHFEAALRSQPGLEYVVACSQKDFGGVEAPINQGKWVIRKQMRTRRPDSKEWDVQLLDTFFVIGHMVCHSPRIADLLWARLLNATASIRSLLQASSDLASFTPALGYHYVSPKLKQSQKSTDPATGPSSAVGSPMQIDGPLESADGREAQAVDSEQDLGASSDHSNLRTLTESFGQFMKYRNEYIDENPLQGEPGSFTFSSTKQSLLARSDASKKPKETPDSTQEVSQKSSITSAKTPQPSQSESQKSQEAPKPKLKRRKSKAPTSPSSPLATAVSSPGAFDNK